MNKTWIGDLSFFSYSQAYGQRRPCDCNNNPNCPNCEGSGQAYLNYNGIRTGGLYGVFSLILTALHEGFEIIIPFDPPKEKLDRMLLLSDYKGGRPPVPDFIKYQQKVLEDILPYIPSIQCYKSDTDESDDVIATIAVEKAKLGNYVVVAGDDKDSFPLLKYDNITLFRQGSLWKTKEFKKWLNKKYGVEFEPERFSEFLAIAGDPADNYKGIDGLGPKAAEYLINKYDRVDNLWADWSNIEEKYKRKLVKTCPGTTCKKCTHSDKKTCNSHGDKLQYKINELNLQLKIAELKLDCKYYPIKKDPDKKYIKSILEKHGLYKAVRDIDLLFKGE